ncbi:MAG: carbohydrate-binding protein [Cellulosilyticaceae bacterium]
MKKVLRTMCLSLMVLLLSALPSTAWADSSPQKTTYTIKYDSCYEASLYTKDVILHYGVNGWNDVKDIPMTLKSSYDENNNLKVWYEATLALNGTDTINYCYYISYNRGSCGGFWDNNNGQDYHITVNKQ